MVYTECAQNAFLREKKFVLFSQNRLLINKKLFTIQKLRHPNEPCDQFAANHLVIKSNQPQPHLSQDFQPFVLKINK